MARIRASGASTPPAVMNVACSIPSTPAATASAMDLALWACAVTGSPWRWASSTMTRSAPAQSCGSCASEPGVMLPPLAITFVTSTPRSARSRTAARRPAFPLTAPPRKWQCPPGVVVAGACSHDRRQRPELARAALAAQVQGQVGAVVQIAHRGHPGAQRPPGRAGHLLAQRLVIGLREVADRVASGVEAQAQVRVNQARHQRQPGQVHDVRARGQRPGRARHGGDHSVGDHHRLPAVSAGLTPSNMAAARRTVSRPAGTPSSVMAELCGGPDPADARQARMSVLICPARPVGRGTCQPPSR
jgi:hypothetical protein